MRLITWEERDTTDEEKLFYNGNNKNIDKIIYAEFECNDGIYNDVILHGNNEVNLLEKRGIMITKFLRVDGIVK